MLNTHSIYEDPIIVKTKSKSKSKNKNTKLPSIKKTIAGKSVNHVTEWDSTPGGGIPSYDSFDDKNADISQIKKFNTQQKSKNKSSSASSAVARLPKKVNGGNVRHSKSQPSLDVIDSGKPVINMRQSLQRRRSVMEHEVQVQQIHNEWNNQRSILENYLMRKIKSRETILTELKSIIRNYSDPVTNNDNNNPDNMTTIFSAQSINRREIIELMNILRLQTLETIEGIQEWKHHFLAIMPREQVQSQIKAGSSSSYSTYASAMNPTSAILPSFQYNNLNYLIKLASDLDFMESFEKQCETFGFDFIYNPLAYPSGGTIITMFNQKFDSSDSNHLACNNNHADTDEFNSNVVYNGAQGQFQQSNILNKNDYMYIDGIEYARLQEAEKAIQWEFDILMNPDLATQAQLQHEYFLRHGYNPNGIPTVTESDTAGGGSDDDNDNNNKSNKKTKIKSKVKYLPADMLQNNNANNMPSSMNRIPLGKIPSNGSAQPLLVPVVAVPPAVKVKKERLKNMEEIHDGLKCAKASLEDELQMSTASYEQMSDQLLKLRKAWQIAVQQSDKQNIVQSLFLKINILVENMSETKKKLSSLQKEIFFKTSECSRVNKNIQKLIEDIKSAENKLKKTKNNINRDNGIYPAHIPDDDLVSEFMYRPDEESTLQTDTVSVLSDVNYQFTTSHKSYFPRESNEINEMYINNTEIMNKQQQYIPTQDNYNYVHESENPNLQNNMNDVFDISSGGGDNHGFNEGMAVITAHIDDISSLGVNTTIFTSSSVDVAVTDTEENTLDIVNDPLVMNDTRAIIQLENNPSSHHIDTSSNRHVADITNAMESLSTDSLPRMTNSASNDEATARRAYDYSFPSVSQSHEINHCSHNYVTDAADAITAASNFLSFDNNFPNDEFPLSYQRLDETNDDIDQHQAHELSSSDLNEVNDNMPDMCQLDFDD